MPIGILTCKSVRPAHKVSSSCQPDKKNSTFTHANDFKLGRRHQTLRSNPNFVPNRMLRTAYGAWLMLSDPPHKTTSDSFKQISYKHICLWNLFQLLQSFYMYLQCLWLCWRPYLSSIDDGLESRSTQPIDSESRNRDRDATPQTHMACYVRCISWALTHRNRDLCLAVDSHDDIGGSVSRFLLDLHTCMTFPMMTLFMSSGAMPPADRAALAACSARSVALWSFRTPP